MVYFIGAGPGAADLITVRGLSLLQKADCVIYAGSLVNKELLLNCKKECALYDSAKMTLEEVIDTIKKSSPKEKVVVRLHSGDPCIYGAIREQMDILDSCGIPYESVPGVSSFCAAAASLGIEYTLPDVSQSVIITRVAGRTPVPERESIRSYAMHKSTMVVFLSTSLVEDLQRELLAGGYSEDTPAAVVYKASWKEEKKMVCTVATLSKTVRDAGIKNSALMIIGDCVT
ncbi:MAG: precorrin-4 C(11)-methyltransferase, partial [Treponema sp.]|nr:precorrin-4 C(11)-methyltransferase [Treponema sp.]